MKRTALVVLIAVIFAVLPVGAEGLGVEAGGLATVGLIQNPNPADTTGFALIVQVLAILFSLRGGPYVDVSAPVGDHASVGLEAAYTAMYLQETAGGDPTQVIMDIPLRIYGRYTMGPLAIQPFNGMNIGASVSQNYGSIWGHYEVGARLYLGGFFVEFSQLMGNPDSTNIFARGYSRAGIGLRLFNDLGDIKDAVVVGE